MLVQLRLRLSKLIKLISLSKLHLFSQAEYLSLRSKYLQQLSYSLSRNQLSQGNVEKEINLFEPTFPHLLLYTHPIYIRMINLLELPCNETVDATLQFLYSGTMRDDILEGLEADHVFGLMKMQHIFRALNSQVFAWTSSKARCTSLHPMRATPVNLALILTISILNGYLMLFQIVISQLSIVQRSSFLGTEVLEVYPIKLINFAQLLKILCLM